MSYFTGFNLDRKVQEYELTDLDTALRSTADGQPWSGDVTLSIDPAFLESLRTVVYSLLHHYGLKGQFIVKLSSGLSQIKVMHRTSPLRTQPAHIQVAQAGPIQAGAGDDAVMDNIFADGQDPLLLDKEEI